MLSPRRLALIPVAFLLLATTAAGAAAPPRMRVDGSVPLPTGSPVRIADRVRQAELERLPAWTDFLSRHGPWNALWNDATQTPHRAFGRGIPLPGFADDPQTVDRAVRRFVAEHSALFGAPTLATVAVDRAGGRWYVRYRQTVSGVPVLFSDWEFRVGLNGKLFAFGADLERPASPVETVARLVGAGAREAAKQGLSFDPATDRVEGGEQLYLVPSATENGAELRLAYDVRVHISDPPGNWYTLVDARSGEVLYRQNQVRYDINGTVTGMVQPDLPTSPFITRPLKHLVVNVGVNSAVSDTSGVYLSPVGTGTVVTVRARILGQFCDVNRQDGGLDADTSTTATSPATVNFPFRSTNSQDSERDAYYNVNIAHNYAKFLEPGFTGLDYVMPVAVNINQTCNAFWDGNGVNFYAAGGGCPNTATMPDVVFHEYGHGVNDKLYIQYGAPSGMTNGALHEGLADVNAAFIQNSPDAGKGFFGPGTILRSLSNTKRWPQDASPDPHATGLIIGGSCWDMRLKLGLPLAEHLVHFAKHGLPDDPDDGVAMSEFFVETLVADDNDADLSNGTPHSGSIAMAFNAHGIGTAYFINISHVPVADQPTGGFYPATAVIHYTGPFGQLDPGSPKLHYSLNSGPYQETNMQPTGNPDEFRGTLPAPAPVVVRYYITAGDNQGGTSASPAFAPAKVYTFLAGTGTTVFMDDMETDPGWVVGDPFDTAVTGIWLRADPVGTFVDTTPVQPEDDHTPSGTQSGTQCFVTGNANPGDPPGTNDVDGGHTTLYSAAFSALPAGMTHPFIEYYRWYSNNAGSTPGEDFWNVDISNDGGSTWHSVEHTQTTENSWMRVIFRIEDLVPPTANMKMRFIAADEGAGSLVEAAVDDFRLIGFPAVAGVEPGRSAVPLAVVPQPSPFRALTSLRFTLPISADVRLSVLDVNGRLVRTLVDGPREAGEHAVVWDGRDGSNARIPVGMYFVRLEQAGKSVTKAVVHVE